MSYKTVIIVPCFNEAKRLNRHYFESLSRINKTLWIFVDDGSTDNTIHILQKLSKIRNIDFLHISQNVGKSRAIVYGMRHVFSTYKDITWLGFLDADAAFSKLDVETIISKTGSIGQFDAIYSSRVKLAGRKILRSKTRHLLARIIATIFGLVWKEIPYDTQSGFKLYRTDKFSDLLLLKPFRTRWFFDIELSMRFSKINRSNMLVWEEPVYSWTDIPGTKLNIRQSFVVLKDISYIISLMIRQRREINN